MTHKSINSSYEQITGANFFFPEEPNIFFLETDILFKWSKYNRGKEVLKTKPKIFNTSRNTKTLELEQKQWHVTAAQPSNFIYNIKKRLQYDRRQEVLNQAGKKKSILTRKQY